MLELRLTPEALRDLEKIYVYTFEKWGINQADKYQDKLHDAMQDILSHPKIGTPYEHSNISFRKLNSGKHLIFYRLDASECLIVRVLHSSYDTESLFQS